MWNFPESRAILSTMPSGWSVHVEIRTLKGDKSFQTYYARVPDRMDAVEVVRKHIGALPDAVIEARKPIQSTVLDAMNIRIGQVGQWV
jgi:hypothetical protein